MVYFMAIIMFLQNNHGIDLLNYNFLNKLEYIIKE
jgi:hypothetical protein